MIVPMTGRMMTSRIQADVFAIVRSLRRRTMSTIATIQAMSTTTPMSHQNHAIQISSRVDDPGDRLRDDR